MFFLQNLSMITREHFWEFVTRGFLPQQFEEFYSFYQSRPTENSTGGPLGIVDAKQNVQVSIFDDLT